MLVACLKSAAVLRGMVVQYLAKSRHNGVDVSAGELCSLSCTLISFSCSYSDGFSSLSLSFLGLVETVYEEARGEERL